MSSRAFQVSKETQGRQRLSELRREMDAIEVPLPEEPLPETSETLEALVETELKAQLRATTDARQMNLTIMNAIKFLAVRARLPVQFGSALDAD